MGRLTKFQGSSICKVRKKGFRREYKYKCGVGVMDIVTVILIGRGGGKYKNQRCMINSMTKKKKKVVGGCMSETAANQTGL